MAKEIKKVSKDELKKSNKTSYGINYKPKKYHSAFFNTVNKDAHSSRPKTVGKLATEIFPEYIESATAPSPEEWKKHYQAKHSQQYNDGLQKFKKQFELEKNAINNVSDEDLTEYYDDLMFNKTFAGLYVQDIILKDIAKDKQATYKKASSDDESKGIDGYIDDIPYSVKSETYKTSAAKNSEKIDATMVYYTENKTTKEIEYYIDEGDDE